MISNSPLQTKLDALKDVLGNLKAQRSPEETLAGLTTANQYLSELVEDLEISQDQVRLAALYRVSHTLGTSLDLDEVLTQVMDAVIGLTGAERGFLALLETSSKNWELRAARNFSQETLDSRVLEISQTVINTVLESGKGLVTTNAQTDPRFAGTDSVVLYALRSILCSPLLSRGNTIGAIYVDNRAHIGLFNQSDLDMLNALAAQAAVAIENARLYTRTDQELTIRVAELETLARMDRQLNTRLDLNHALEITHQWVTRETKSDQVWIVFAEDGNLEGEVITYPQGFVDYKDVIVLRALAEPATQVDVPGDDGMARLVIPIVHSGRLLGVIVIRRAGFFSESETSFLEHQISRAAAAIQNAQLYQAVQQMSDAKTEFISIVTHELRVPMTSIKGYTDLLRQAVVGPVNEEQLNFLDVIRKNVERMSTLVSDLADISKIESGRINMAISFIPLRMYVEEALRSLRPSVEEKGQLLEVEVSQDLPQVYADYSRLIQVVSNLVTNASKFTSQGGRIRVAARQEGEFVRLEVIDNGIGISPQDQAKLFTQFFRVDDPKVLEEPGWGLGLSITKRLVELMGGKIGVTSVFGEGSTFWFTLPTTAGEGENEESKN